MSIKIQLVGFITALGLGLAACRGNGDRVNNTTESSSSTPTEANLLGEDISALNSQYLEIESSTTTGASFKWSQISGPSVTFIDTQSNTAKLLTPSVVATGERATLKVERTIGSEVESDTIDIILSPCAAGTNDIFIDCVAPGFGALRSYEQENDNPEGFKDGVYYTGSAERHIDWQLINTGETGHDTVIEVTFGANDPFNEFEANGWFGIGAPDELGPPSVNRLDLSAYKDGALSYDYRHIAGDFAPIVEVGMECGYPCTSERKPELAMGEWQTATISLAALAESGVDLSRLDVAFLFSTQWWNQNWNIIQIDNIRLSQTYLPPAIDEPARPTGLGLLQLDLLDENNNLRVGAGTAGVTLSQSDTGYTMDYTSEGGFTWFYSEFEWENNSYPDLSAFYHGELVIHYTVNSWGKDTDGRFVINSYCGPACGLFPSYVMPRAPENVATILRIPIADLVARGLDLSNVGRLFQFKLRNSNPEGISMTLHELYLELPEQ